MVAIFFLWWIVRFTKIVVSYTKHLILKIPDWGFLAPVGPINLHVNNVITKNALNNVPKELILNNVQVSRSLW